MESAVSGETRTSSSTIDRSCPVRMLRDVLKANNDTKEVLYVLIYMGDEVTPAMVDAVYGSLVVRGTGWTIDEAKTKSAIGVLNRLGYDCTYERTMPSFQRAEEKRKIVEEMVQENPVDTLEKYCFLRRWPRPIYICDTNTVTCIVGKYKAEAIGDEAIGKRNAADQIFRELVDLNPPVAVVASGSQLESASSHANGIGCTETGRQGPGPDSPATSSKSTCSSGSCLDEHFDSSSPAQIIEGSVRLAAVSSSDSDGSSMLLECRDNPDSLLEEGIAAEGTNADSAAVVHGLEVGPQELERVRSDSLQSSRSSSSKGSSVSTLYPAGPGQDNIDSPTPLPVLERPSSLKVSAARMSPEVPSVDTILTCDGEQSSVDLLPQFSGDSGDVREPDFCDQVVELSENNPEPPTEFEGVPESQKPVDVGEENDGSEPSVKKRFPALRRAKNFLKKWRRRLLCGCCLPSED